jgi:hypothetical protein
MDWSKDINFMLALAAEHQKVPIRGGKTQIDLKAVLEIVNHVFQHTPSFANKFPQGLSDSGKLQSQWNDRMRPHKQNPAQHRHASWAFQRELCTPQEIQRLTPLGDTVINAERALSQNPGSSVRDPGPNAIRWTQYDVRAPIARPATLNASSNAQSVSDEEEQDEEAEEDGEDEAEMTTMVNPATQRLQLRLVLELPGPRR